MTPDRFRQIRLIFEAALDRAPAHRDAYLEQACQGDAELGVEVARLLAAHGEPTRLPHIAPVEEVRLEGRRLGPYEVLRQIGHGGMGVVYLAARADQAFRRRVAIKVIRPEAASPELLARFQREREILASLQHPNIAALLDGGTTEEGWPYLVMEYIEGEPIDQYCDRNRLTIEGRLRLFDQVCAAVQHAHTRQVIHRDLKPNNILVTSAGEVKLLDFGIAHSNEMSRTLTQAGMRAMTPEYASPEQVRGDAVGVPSDVYSLGVVLYELLTGQPPLRLRSRVFHEIARAICEDSPKAPSTVVTELPDAAGHPSASPEARARLRESSLVELQSRLKGELDHVVLHALDKNPANRYLSAEQLRQDLERYRNQEPVIACASSVPGRLWRFLLRRKHPLAACFLLTVALSSGAVRIELGALRWVAAAAAVLGMMVLATSQRWGRAAARIIVSNQALVGMAFAVIVFSLMVTLDPTLRTRNFVRLLEVGLLGVGLVAVWWRRRDAGPLLTETFRKTVFRYFAAGFAALEFTYSLFSSRPDWPSVLVWTAIAVWWATVVGRLQVHQRGILASGFWIPWGKIESWTWLHPDGADANPDFDPEYWLLRIEIRTSFPIFSVFQMKVAASSRENIDAAMVRYLAVWPTHSAPAASLPATHSAS